MNRVTGTMRVSETNDRDVRHALREFVRLEHETDSGTIFFEEFALYGGENRADLAALNGCSHGYEIKSGRDTLDRLPQQVRAYNSVFDRATLVSATRHLEQACLLIPSWWGVVEVRRAPAGVWLDRLRESSLNPAPEPLAIASLLWRPEALHILSLMGLDGRVRSKPMCDLIDRLATSIPSERLSSLVREALRARGDWRSAARRKRCDGMSRRPASLWRSPRAPYGNTPR